MSKRGREEEGNTRKIEKKFKDRDEAEIFMALLNHQHEVATDLMDFKAEAVAPNITGWPQLHKAAYFRYTAVARLMIQNLADAGDFFASAVKSQKEEALHIAASWGAVGVAKLLLEDGVDINAKPYGKAIILSAASTKLRRNVDMMKLLCQYGADVNAVNAVNVSALQICACTDLEYSARVLLENGADVNHVGGWDKATPLHDAARGGFVDFAKLLIKYGADVNAVNKDNWTALHYSVFSRHGPYVDEEQAGYAPLIPMPPSEYHTLTLQLICCGAKITKNTSTFWKDRTELLSPIEDRLKLLQDGKPMGTTLMSEEERRFMWNLAFFFTWKYRVAAFPAYYTIRSFITYNGIFMGPGYDLGPKSIWRNVVEVEV